MPLYIGCECFFVERRVFVHCQLSTLPRVAHAHYAGIPKKLHLRFALLWGDKPPVVATDAPFASAMSYVRGSRCE